MVYEVIPQSVAIKTTIFDEPAKLINHMELAAAVGMAYRQAGMQMPDAQPEEDMREFRNRAMEKLENREKVNAKLIRVIESYVFKKGEKIDEDALMTLRLGYDLKG